MIIEVYFLYASLLGVELNEMGRSEEAINDHSQAIEINPQDAVSYLHRGNNFNILQEMLYLAWEKMKMHLMIIQRLFRSILLTLMLIIKEAIIFLYLLGNLL